MTQSAFFRIASSFRTCTLKYKQVINRTYIEQFEAWEEIWHGLIGARMGRRG
jgi:hypothetical protein